MKKVFLLLIVIQFVIGCGAGSEKDEKGSMDYDRMEEEMATTQDTGMTVYNEPELSDIYPKDNQTNENNMGDTISSANDILTPAELGCTSFPTSMAQLTGGMQKFLYKFTSRSTASLAVFGYGGGSIGRDELLLIVDFVQHKSVPCADKQVKYGVGARLFLNIKEIKGKVNTNSLPQLAAAAEFGRATVTYDISTIGITGDKVLDVLPTGSEFNVETYAKVVSSIDQIIRLAKDQTPGVIVEPQILPVLQ